MHFLAWYAAQVLAAYDFPQHDYVYPGPTAL